VQTPALPGSAQEAQVPGQAVAQHTSCAQMPVLHSASLAQVAPMGTFPQLPFMQVLGARQSASLVQVVLHRPEAPQVNGAQGWLCAAAQTPCPSQRCAKVSVEPVQPAGWQMTPAEYFSQAPVPSQTPSLPHAATPWSSQLWRGSVPTSAGIHLPRLSGLAQVRQMPSQASLQHTPSAQNPEAHWLPAEQADPIDPIWPPSAVE
jgi:hypothetical protein